MSIPTGDSSFDSWVEGQVSPEILAQLVMVSTQNSENLIEGAQNTVLGDISKDSTDDILAMDKYIQAYTATMSGCTDSTTMTGLNANLNILQTKASQMNTNLSAEVQGVQTSVTDLTQTQAQTLQSFQVILNWLSKLSGNLEALK